jgi:hypothetical protein
MLCCLGPWVKDLEPFEHWRMPDGALGGVDLRSNAQQTEAGVGFFVIDGDLPSGYELLCNGHPVRNDLSARTRAVWEGLAGFRLPVGSKTVQCALWDHLAMGCDPVGLDACKPMGCRHNRVTELWLGPWGRVRHGLFSRSSTHPHGQLYRDMVRRDLMALRADCLERGSDHYRRVMQANIEKHGWSFEEIKPRDWPADETPLPHSTTITESFDTEDSDTLGPDLSWTEISGDWDIVTNQASARTTTAGGATNLARAETDLAGDDHYAQVLVTTANPPSAQNQGGACTCRHSASALTYYVVQLDVTSAPVYRMNVFRRVTGTFAQIIANANFTPSLPHTVKITADGSTIGMYRDDVLIDSTTDTNITGNTRCGLSAFLRNGSAGDLEVDDFEAADLAAGGQTITPDPVVATWSAVAPTVTVGEVVATPDPVTATWSVVAPTVTVGAVTATPDPVAATWSVPSPTIVLGGVTTTPDPVTATWSVPAPTVDQGGAQTTTPDPVVATWSVAAPTIRLTISPDPVAATWSVPAPTITLGAVTATPDPATATWSAPSPTIVLGGVTTTPDPVSATWTVAAPTVQTTITTQPDPAVATWSAPAPTIALGAVIAAPDPAVATWSVPVPVASGGEAQTGLMWQAGKRSTMWRAGARSTIWQAGKRGTHWRGRGRR